MKKNLSIFLVSIFSLFVLSCNQNLTDEEKANLYKKSTTRENIIDRSGTILRAGTDQKKMDAQLDDALSRLQSGGGLLGKKPSTIGSFGNQDSEKTVASIGLPINPYLWKGSLETIEFMPLISADPFAGVIITDWYTDQNNTNERCKLNIFIKGVELKTNNLKVNSYCQTFSENGNWIDQKVNSNNNILLENAILNKAKKIRLSQS